MDLLEIHSLIVINNMTFTLKKQHHVNRHRVDQTLSVENITLLVLVHVYPITSATPTKDVGQNAQSIRTVFLANRVSVINVKIRALERVHHWQCVLLLTISHHVAAQVATMGTHTYDVTSQEVRITVIPFVGCSKVALIQHCNLSFSFQIQFQK